MTRMRRTICALAISALLAGCQALSPASAPVAEAPTPAPTTIPTAAEPAPEKTFTEVGDVGQLTGSHGIAGKAIIAGLQTLIIQGFTYDGKAPADMRLVMGDDAANPAAILGTLEERAYEQEFLLYTIPSSVTRDNADRLVVYAPETGEVLAEATFD